MRFLLVILALFFVLSTVVAQETKEEPTDEKALKTYEKAQKSLHEHKKEFALDDFKKADKQDGGHCLACQKQMIKLGSELGEWKTAELGAEEIIAEAQGPKDTALTHYQLAVVLLEEGLQKHKAEIFARSHEEVNKALAAYSNFPDALFVDGRALAQLKRDDEARARFEQFVKSKPPEDPDCRCAPRYINRPELARARMVPAFSVTTIDGQRISMDDLQGKVVLLDFWATWCVPCREALPHIQKVAKRFQGEPLVILSVSLDSDEQKWKEFITKNEMTWPQYRDGGFTSPITRLFAVNVFPHTFTIDADGVLQDEHIGDASIEGKLKKLIARARELQSIDNPSK
jgi:thiol-disulfide isomerase/thioredoxin